MQNESAGLKSVLSFFDLTSLTNAHRNFTQLDNFRGDSLNWGGICNIIKL